MFSRKKRTPEQIEYYRQLVTFVLVQGLIFSTLLFISRLTGIAYNMLLMIGGAIITLLLIPSGLELHFYMQSSQNAGLHRETLQQIFESRFDWRANLERFSIGLIPFMAGVILSLL